MADHKQFRKALEGFTLAEIVISMGILALGVMSTIGLTRWVVQGTDFNRKATAATFLAQDKLEDLRSTSYTLMASGSDSTQNMTRAWTVTTVGNYKELAVSVSWTGLDQQTRTASFKSLVAAP